MQSKTNSISIHHPQSSSSSVKLDPESEKVRVEFSQGLEKLTFNCKNTITSLTEYARLRISSAPGVVSALEEKIYRSSPGKKLPFLYLLDSIVKNIGGVYLELFSRHLKAVFLDSYNAIQDEKLKSSFRRVLQTWRVVFPPLLIHSMEQAIFGENVPQNYSEISAQALSTLMQQTGRRNEQIVPVGKPSNARSSNSSSIVSSSSLNARSPAVSSSSTSSASSTLNALSPQLIASLQSLNIPLFSTSTSNNASAASGQIKNASSFAASGQPPTEHQTTTTVNITLATKSQNSSQKLPSTYLASSTFVNQRYQEAHRILYRALRSSCASCGLRFPDNPSGKERLSLHLDWHYRRNRRIKEKYKRPISRDWFPTKEEWQKIDPIEALTAGSGAGERQTLPIFEVSSSTATASQAIQRESSEQNSTSNPPNKSQIEKFGQQPQREHFVPTRLAYDCKNCPICGEKFKLEWNEELDEWVYENAILDEDEMAVHFTCAEKNTSSESTNSSNSSKRQKTF